MVAVEFQQLRYVIAVAEEAGFTRAAQRCHVVQSALSHQVKALETELGVQLFARTSRRVELTAAGHAFLPQARASLAAAQRAGEEAAASVGQVRGRLRLSVIPTVTALDLPALLRRFRTAHPQARVALRVAASEESEAGVADGSIDVAVLGLPANRRPQGVASRTLVRDRLVAVLGSGHRLAGRRRLTLGDLAGEEFADFPAGTAGRAQSDLAFAAAGLHRDVTYELTSSELMLALVRENLAVTLLASRFVPADPALVAIPLTKGPTRTEYLVWSDFNPSATVEAFLALLDPAPR